MPPLPPRRRAIERRRSGAIEAGDASAVAQLHADGAATAAKLGPLAAAVADLAAHRDTQTARCRNGTNGERGIEDAVRDYLHAHGEALNDAARLADIEAAAATRPLAEAVAKAIADLPEYKAAVAAVSQSYAARQRSLAWSKDFDAVRAAIHDELFRDPHA